MKSPIGLALLLTLMMSGCGLVFGGGRSTVPIDSYPQGAKVLVNGIEAGETPMVLRADADEDQVVTLRHPNGVEKSVELESSVHGGYAFADILLGLVPVIIDAATGGWSYLQPESLHVELSADQSGPPSSDERYDD